MWPARGENVHCSQGDIAICCFTCLCLLGEVEYLLLAIFHQTRANFSMFWAVGLILSSLSCIFLCCAIDSQVLLPSSAQVILCICRNKIFNLWTYNFWILYSYSLLNLWCDLSNWLSILLIFGVICRVSLIPCISLSTPLSISYFRFSLPHAHLSLHLLSLIKSLSQVLSKLWLNWGLNLFKINYLPHENDEFLWYSHDPIPVLRVQPVIWEENDWR